VDKLFGNARLRSVNALLCQGQKRVEKFLCKQTQNIQKLLRTREQCTLSKCPLLLTELNAILENVSNKKPSDIKEM
jgi:hypothetical protein